MALVVIGSPLRAQQDDHEHDHGVHFDSSEYTKEQLARIDRLFGIVVCACPREDWTLSLTGCPRGCADEQKREIREQVKQGWSDEKVLAFQVEKYGPKAVGRTSAEGLTGFAVYVGPILFLAALALALFFALRAVTRPTPDSRAEKAAARATSDGTGAAAVAAVSADDQRLDAEIERELEDME